MGSLTDTRRQLRPFRLRLLVAGCFALLCFALLTTRFWWLQVVRHSAYVTRADNNRISVVPIPPKRGEIFDRNGEILARNVSTWTLEITPAETRNLQQTIEALSKIVPISDIDIRRFKRQQAEYGRFESIPIRTRLTDEETAAFAVQSFRFQGVELRARWTREYPQGATAAHVIGYINRISQRDAERLEEQDKSANYRGTQHIGKEGVERYYEDALHGRVGAEEVEVTATGRPVRTLRRTDPIPGKDLLLSLDLGLQRVAEQAFEGRRGALVAIEPATGDILAFVSLPSFDPNLFVNGIDVENWKALSESPDRPLINRPLYGTYPIGSTYKPFMALAALELGLRTPEQTQHDPGYFELAGHRFRNAGSTAYGSVNLHRSLVVSSDTYYYSLASEMGVNRIHDFMKPFGFGQLTGIDLDGEKPGLLPSTDWKRRAYKKPSEQRWYTGETVSVGIGQGYNAFTILQLAQATAVLANDGNYMRPHVVKIVQDKQTGEETPTVSRASHQIPIKPANLGIVKRALADVNRTGTGRIAFQGAPYVAAGKTGTAQVFSLRGERYRASAIDERLRDHALFMAFAPLDRPTIAVALLIENGGWGSQMAAPVARKIFDYWLLERGPQTMTAANTEQAGPPMSATPRRDDAVMPMPANTAPVRLPVAAPAPTAPAAGSGAPRSSFTERTREPSSQ